MLQSREIPFWLLFVFGFDLTCFSHVRDFYRSPCNCFSQVDSAAEFVHHHLRMIHCRRRSYRQGGVPDSVVATHYTAKLSGIARCGMRADEALASVAFDACHVGRPTSRDRRSLVDVKSHSAARGSIWGTQSFVPLRLSFIRIAHVFFLFVFSCPVGGTLVVRDDGGSVILTSRPDGRRPRGLSID